MRPARGPFAGGAAGGGGSRLRQLAADQADALGRSGATPSCPSTAMRRPNRRCVSICSICCNCWTQRRRRHRGERFDGQRLRRPLLLGYEAFVLPVMAFTAPEVARAMLLYRYRTLEAARAHAREWTVRSVRCTPGAPSMVAKAPALPQRFGGVPHERHDRLRRRALPREQRRPGFPRPGRRGNVFETARIWPQAGHFNPRRGGAFCIHESPGRTVHHLAQQ